MLIATTSVFSAPVLHAFVSGCMQSAALLHTCLYVKFCSVLLSNLSAL
jgi:hypothetical protein